MIEELNLFIQESQITSISPEFLLPPPPENLSPEVITSGETFPQIYEDIMETNPLNNDDFLLVNLDLIFPTQLTTTNEPSVEFSNLLGGRNFEDGTGITTDNEGNIYVTGSTNSLDFPVTSNAVQNSFSGGDGFSRGDAFVAKYSPDGSLIYATYIGGSGEDFGTDIAVDASGDIYVTGNTNSANFPTVNSLQSSFGGGEFSGDAFVVKLSNDGSNILYSTYLGGQDNDMSNSIAVDNNGNIYITGDTGALLRFPITPLTGVGDFPTTENALQNTLVTEFNRDAFVSKISSDGSQLVYSTLLGGNDQEVSNDISVDNIGNVYITGDTRSVDFPTLNPVQNSLGGDKDVFITQLNSDGSELVFSTYYGALDGDTGNGIAVDNTGNIYVGGTSASQIIGGDAVVPPVGEFPTVNALQDTFGGGEGDGILIKINSDRSVGYATYFGGENSEFIEDIGLDAEGNTYIIGNDNFADAFVSKISNDGAIVEYSTFVETDSNFRVFGNDIAVDEEGNAYIIGSTNSTVSPEFSQNDSIITSDAFIAKLISDTAGIPPFIPPVPSIPESFNETLYLTENPGVADAVVNGLVGSGFEHWLQFGFFEGRSPQFPFDEEFYLNTYPEVAEAVANGEFINGLEHYFRFGEAEGRIATN
ncbi:MAG: SBBP repeat-containing protein [Microcoleaceae cyanobacterium MO_207.B10]|nr:SBBP repeat-containing protein [Microcoleaceae cyanobacterium MO_207.B10]